VTIAGVVGFTELVVNKTSPVLHQSLGVFLPLITTNCAVLGVALLNVNQDNGFLASAVYGFGAAIGHPAKSHCPHCVCGKSASIWSTKGLPSILNLIAA
jgi:Na+-translocating ferredoxin:NAD+ oxidoreductase RnfA subunit